jgi:hypothetical protein
MYWHCYGFCPTIVKNKLNSVPKFPRGKKWTGWELNPRPEPAFSKAVLLTSYLKGRSVERELYGSNPTQFTLFYTHAATACAPIDIAYLFLARLEEYDR